MNWIYHGIPQQLIRIGRPIPTLDAIDLVSARLSVSRRRVSGDISALVRAGQLGITAPGTVSSTLI